MPVGVDLAQVDRNLRDRLRTVDHDDRARRVRAAHDLGDRVDRAEHVRDVHDADDLHVAAREQRVELVEQQPAVVVDAHVVERRPGGLAGELPRHDPRVVLHLGHDHAVAGPEVRVAPRVGDEVERLGRVAREDRVACGPAQPVGSALARALVEVGRLVRERIDAAVHARAVALVVIGHRGDDRGRRLRGGRRVEVDEAIALQRRELERRNCLNRERHQADAPTSSRIQP
jgi:hypothetical protein